ncbi:MAG: DinB family protein, partial [Thermoanaerobaculia bacterium]|nr:DinB family protein [Thermoanaerobaculia bacterium]
MSSDLRRSLASQLRSSQAHAGLQRSLEGLSFRDAGRRADAHAHTAWELVEHLRRAAEDLVDYCRDEDYRMPSWPEAFWPDESAPADAEAWRESREAIRSAVESMASLIEDTDRPLFEP